MTRMSEERLAEIQAEEARGECHDDTALIRQRSELLAEVDALRAELDMERAGVEAVEEVRREERTALTAELSKAQELVAAFQAASLLEIGGDPDGITPAHVEREVTSLRAELSASHSLVIRVRDADRLADEVAVLIRRRMIDARSPVGDALQDFRSPPSTERADRLAMLESELSAFRRAALTDGAGGTEEAGGPKVDGFALGATVQDLMDVVEDVETTRTPLDWNANDIAQARKIVEKLLHILGMASP